MAALLEAYITNLGKYAEGQLVGETLKFPTTAEEVQSLLKRIGVDGIRYEEIFITNFDGDVLGLHEHLGEYESIDELNYLAALLSEMDQSVIEKFEAVIDAGEYTGSVKDLINLTQNLDCFEFYSGVRSDEELGCMYVLEFGGVEVPEHLIDYIDYEAYGRDVRINDGGHYAPGGYENDFIKAMMGRSARVAETDRARKQRELDALLARDKELDMLFERLYEDNVSGKIDDARFAKMAKRYEQEQGEAAGKIKALRLELKKADGMKMDMDFFLETIRRYTDATAITRRMVGELIDHIDVYHAEKRDGVTNQRVVIHYNCIGAFDVPDRRKIPEADIIMETRKGVAVSYAPAQIAV